MKQLAYNYKKSSHGHLKNILWQGWHTTGHYGFSYSLGTFHLSFESIPRQMN